MLDTIRSASSKPPSSARPTRSRRTYAIDGPRASRFSADLDESQREQLVVDAWSIGLRALHNAHSAAQESKLKDVGDALVSDIDRQLRAHIDQQQATIAGVLERFFDPKDGQVTQRLEAFVDDQGVLARLLEKYSRAAEQRPRGSARAAGGRVEPAVQEVELDGCSFTKKFADCNARGKVKFRAVRLLVRQPLTPPTAVCDQIARRLTFRDAFHHKIVGKRRAVCN